MRHAEPVSGARPPGRARSHCRRSTVAPCAFGLELSRHRDPRRASTPDLRRDAARAHLFADVDPHARTDARRRRRHRRRRRDRHAATRAPALAALARRRRRRRSSRAASARDRARGALATSVSCRSTLDAPSFLHTTIVCASTSTPPRSSISRAATVPPSAISTTRERARAARSRSRAPPAALSVDDRRPPCAGRLPCLPRTRSTCGRRCASHAPCSARSSSIDGRGRRHRGPHRRGRGVPRARGSRRAHRRRPAHRRGTR